MASFAGDSTSVTLPLVQCKMEPPSTYDESGVEESNVKLVQCKMEPPSTYGHYDQSGVEDSKVKFEYSFDDSFLNLTDIKTEAMEYFTEEEVYAAHAGVEFNSTEVKTTTTDSFVLTSFVEDPLASYSSSETTSSSQSSRGSGKSSDEGVFSFKSSSTSTSVKSIDGSVFSFQSSSTSTETARTIPNPVASRMDRFNLGDDNNASWFVIPTSPSPDSSDDRELFSNDQGQGVFFLGEEATTKTSCLPYTSINLREATAACNVIYEPNEVFSFNNDNIIREVIIGSDVSCNILNMDASLMGESAIVTNEINMNFFTPNENVPEFEVENHEYDVVDGKDYSTVTSHTQNVPIKRRRRLNRSNEETEPSGNDPIVLVPKRKKRTSTSNRSDVQEISRSQHTKRRMKQNSDLIYETCKRRLEPFRTEMGPFLRIITALLETTGLKHVSTIVPYEIKRRFHPTDIYRTIYKTTLGAYDELTYVKPTISLEEPDWENWNLQAEGSEVNQKPYDIPGEPAERLYYWCQYGINNNDPLTVKVGVYISLPKELESEGRPSYSPDVLTSVGSANLNVKVNLKHLATTCNNSEFKGPNTPLIIRLRDTKCYGLLYDTGKLIVVGAKTFEEFRKSARKFARIVQKVDDLVRLTCLKMHFYVGLTQLPFNINIAGLAQHKYLSQYIMYTPNIFPGLALYLRSSSVLCFIFETGEVLMTDAPGVDNLKAALDTIYPCLRSFGHY